MSNPFIRGSHEVDSLNIRVENLVTHSLQNNVSPSSLSLQKYRFHVILYSIYNFFKMPVRNKDILSL